MLMIVYYMYVHCIDCDLSGFLYTYEALVGRVFFRIHVVRFLAINCFGHIQVFPKKVVPQNGRFIMENPI